MILIGEFHPLPGKNQLIGSYNNGFSPLHSEKKLLLNLRLSEKSRYSETIARALRSKD
ncbi:MAG: hypothetical protein ACI9DF_003280 [Verrucomicrobiales bacterium]